MNYAGSAEPCDCKTDSSSREKATQESVLESLNDEDEKDWEKGKARQGEGKGKDAWHEK